MHPTAARGSWCASPPPDPGTVPSPMGTPAGELRLTTFNAHYGVLPVRGRTRRHYDVIATLAGFDADVLVIQETMRPDGESGDVDAFAAEHGYDLHFALVGRTSLTTRWPRLDPAGEATSGVSVLTRLPSRRLDDLVLGPTPGDPSPERAAVQVEVDVAGAPLRVIGVHLTSRLLHGPPIQLRKLSGLVPPAGTPTIVAGDCNFWGPPVTLLMPGWRRAVKGRTWPWRAPHSQIDHILYRRGEVEVIDGSVLGHVGSDHLPVTARLRVRS